MRITPATMSITTRQVFTGCVLTAVLCMLPSWGKAQERFQDRDRGRHDSEFTRLERGAIIGVRTNHGIDADRRSDRIYTGTVDQDVWGENGRIAIPRGSNAELAIRVAPDNDLILDIDSVVINGRRYEVSTEPNRVESEKDRSVVGTIVRAINGGRVRGRDVHVPRDTVLTFRLERPLEMRVRRDRDDDRDRDR
jgi:hypothetical protein